MPNEFKSDIRDFRNGNWYWIDREILRRYGKKLKASGLAIYNILASYANLSTQSCFPTQATMAKIIGISKRTVIRKIKLLKNLGLIRVKKRKDRCVYYLLEPTVTKKTYRGDKRNTREVTPWHINKNNITIINNKNNNDKKNFNNFKPIRQLIKKHAQKSSKNHRH